MANKTKVVVTTAVELTPDQKKLLRAKLRQKLGREFELIERVDKKVIGGLSLSVDDQVKNATIAAQLDQLESQLSQVEVVSAVPLTKEQKTKLTQQIQAKHGKLPIKFKVDSQVIGGLKLNIGYLEFDATLKTKLNKLKTHIMGSF